MIFVNKKESSKFIDKAPNVRDWEIQSTLSKFHEKHEFFHRGDGSSSNNFFPPSPPPPPPSPYFPNPRSPSLLSDLFNIPNVPRVDKFLNNNDFNFDFFNGSVPPGPDPPPLSGFAWIFFQTDHRQLKLHRTWEQIWLKLDQTWEQIRHK